MPSPVVMVTDGALPPGRLLRFDQPQGLLVALRPKEVPGCLQEADAALAQGYHVAICSASPELFFALKGVTLTVRPMKGTLLGQTKTNV